MYTMIHQYGIKGTPEVYTIAVNSCSKSGDWDFACSIYNDMKEKGVIPDEVCLFLNYVSCSKLHIQLERILAIMSEVPSSSDHWDETNITCCGFGPMRITRFGPEPLGIKKKVTYLYEA